MPVIEANRINASGPNRLRVCFYPVVNFNSQLELPATADPFIFKDQANQTLRNLKTLLLFHDHVAIGLLQFFYPYTTAARCYFETLLEHPEFIPLCNSGLIIDHDADTSKGFYGNVLYNAAAHFDAGAPEKHQLTDRLVHFDDARIPLMQACPHNPIFPNMVYQSMRDQLEENLLELDEKQKTTIWTLAGDSPITNWRQFNAFLLKLKMNNKDEMLNTFRKASSMSIYRIGDKFTDRFLVPYLGKSMGDSLLRTAPQTGAYAYLLSPGYFRQFLSLIFGSDMNMNERLGRLKVNQLVELHGGAGLAKASFWRDFLQEFHDSVIEISKKLGEIPEQEFLSEMQLKFDRRLYGRLGEWSTSELIQHTASAALSSSSASILSPATSSAFFKRHVKFFVNKQILRCKHPAMHKFAVWFDRATKLR